VKIRIERQARRLILLLEAGLQQEYPISLGRNSLADKSVEGDCATPLGDFYVCAKNPRSKHFLSLCLSYPNAEDAERGLRDGLITAAEHAQILEAIRCRRMPPQHTRLGGELYIHGARPEEGGTRGCVAVDNAAMQVIFDLAVVGTAVSIVD